MANSNFSVVDLDFDTLKSNFIDYLRSQTQFSDYNFDGSAINSLLDVMTYNTFKNAFYLNMVMSESFLDSAQMIESVYSHAKELNYLPRSARSSSAKITMSFKASGDSMPYIIPRGAEFQTIIKQKSYTFVTNSSQILTPTVADPTKFTATFDIYEGIIINDTFIMDYNKTNQRFLVTNKSIDTDSIEVTVFENNETVGKIYTRASSLLDLNESSEVYFIQAANNGSYEILFGDNVLGKKPANGSAIQISYRSTKGSEGNGAQVFTASFDPTAANELTSVVTIEVENFSEQSLGRYSVNGDAAEDIESIRFYAPRAFQTQERAVTARDYETILKAKYPEINAISVYGGEEATPPQYGKVFIAVDLKNVVGLPDAKKLEYYGFLKTRSPLSVDPVFIEPEYTFLKVVSDVKFNVNLTSKSTQTIKSSVLTAIQNYVTTNLSGFGSVLRSSKLMHTIDSVDTSIVGNVTDTWLYKKIAPVPGTPTNYNLNFKTKLNEIYYVLDTIRKKTEVLINIESDERVEHIVSSSMFTYKGDRCELEDNGDGVVRIVRKVGNQHNVIKNIGTVNYETGLIQLTDFTVDSFDGDSIRIYAQPGSKDVTSAYNTIVEIEATEITVNVEAIRE